MTIVTITPAFIIDKLQTLPPHSRLRAGYVDMMRHLRREQLLQDHMDRMFDDAIALMDVSDVQRARIEESW